MLFFLYMNSFIDSYIGIAPNALYDSIQKLQAPHNTAYLLRLLQKNL